MGRHDWPAQVGLDGKIAERRLRESPGENRDRELLRPPSERRPESRHRNEERDQDRHAADDPVSELDVRVVVLRRQRMAGFAARPVAAAETGRSEEHTSELQSQSNLVCRLLLEKKKHTEQQREE